MQRINSVVNCTNTFPNVLSPSFSREMVADHLHCFRLDNIIHSFSNLGGVWGFTPVYGYLTELHILLLFLPLSSSVQLQLSVTDCIYSFASVKAAHALRAPSLSSPTT